MTATRKKLSMFVVTAVAGALVLTACGRTAGTDDVDNINDCTTEVPLTPRSAELENNADSIEAVTWTSQPTIKAGTDTLEATGILAQGVALFDPLNDGDSPAFSVYYKGNKESLVELVPDRPAGECWDTTGWDTTATIAPTEVGTPEGGAPGFTIRASSPLFMDTDASELELRVWGTDADGEEALLSVVAIGDGVDNGDGTAPLYVGEWHFARNGMVTLQADAFTVTVGDGTTPVGAENPFNVVTKVVVEGALTVTDEMLFRLIVDDDGVALEYVDHVDPTLAVAIAAIVKAEIAEAASEQGEFHVDSTTDPQEMIIVAPLIAKLLGLSGDTELKACKDEPCSTE